MPLFPVCFAISVALCLHVCITGRKLYDTFFSAPQKFLGNLQKDRLSLFVQIYRSVKGQIEAVKIPVIMKLLDKN